MRRIILSLVILFTLTPAVHAETKYSIWLSPSGKEYERLSMVIRQLAKKHGTPVFMPHLTVVGDLDVTFARALEMAQQIAKEEDPILIVWWRIGYTENRWRSFYLSVENPSLRLQDLHERSYRITGNYHSWPYHISLMYIDGMKPSTKASIADALEGSGAIPRFVTLDRLRVCTSGDDPTTWTCPADVSLRK